MQVPNGRTLVRYHRQSGSGLRLFCFPYAGGTAATYRGWSEALAEHLDVVAVEYPGRGVRRHERPLKRLAEIVDALIPEIAPEIAGPFAFFGHSMGALIVYELLSGLLRRGCDPPICVFMSGCQPPKIRNAEQKLHELPDDELIEELRKMEGTPEELLADADLMSLAFPVLRADFEAVANYAYNGDMKLSCPIFVYGGMHDRTVTLEELEYWREITSARCTVRIFPGNHFFIQSERQMLLSVLLKDVLSCAKL